MYFNPKITCGSLRSAQFQLATGQVIVLAGCFSGDDQDSAWVFIGGNTVPETTQKYNSNAQEASMNVWRHATQTQYQHNYFNIFP